MNRYRLWLFAAAVSAGLAYGGAWYAAGAGPGVVPTSDRLAVPLDDAAIYFQYARQALHGDWLRYNPGAPLSTGLTSQLYFLLMVLGMGLGLSGPAWAWLLGLASLLLGLVCADRVARRLFKDLPHWWAGALLLSQGAWVAAHFNGMETGLLLGLSWALMDALSLEPAPKEGAAGRDAAAWALMAALAFCRPEGQVLVALLGCAWAWPRPRRVAGALLLALAPSLVLILISGTAVPDSVRPKTAALTGGLGLLDHASQASAYAIAVLKGAWMGFWGGADPVGNSGDAAAGNPIGPQFPPLALLGALLGFCSLALGPRRRLALGLALSLAALLVLLSWDLPVGWHQYRYLACATPLLLLGMLAGLQALRADARPVSSALAAALFVLWTGFGLAGWSWHLQRCYSGALRYAQSNTNAALALRRLPPGPVAVVDSGLLAYYSGREIVDLPGVTDHALGLAERQGWGSLLKALLKRPRPPLYAVLHDGRPDFDPALWVDSNLLRPEGYLAPGMGLYRWNWDHMDLRLDPAAAPQGHAVLGAVDIADLDGERAQEVRFSGPDCMRTFLARLRLKAGGPQVAEGGRKVGWLRLGRVPAATRHLLLRAAFDRDGRLSGSVGPDAAGGRDGVEVRSSASEVYSEVDVPVQAPPGLARDACFSVDLDFAAAGDKGGPPAPRDFAVYRIWYLN